MTFMILVIGAIYLIIITAVDGFVLSMLWDWFLAYKFSLPSLSIWDAAGLILMGRLLIRAKNKENSFDFEYTNDREFWATVFLAFLAEFLYPIFSLVIGWTIHTFFL